jgi:hypothetical protein
MQRIRQFSLVKSLLLPFVLMLWLSACYKWESVDPQYATYIVSQGEADKLRVMTARDTIVLLSADVRGDTLVGVRGDSKTHEAYQSPDFPTVLNVPTSELTSVEIERFNVVGSVGLAAGVAIGTVLTTYGLKAAADAAEDLCFSAFC